MSENDDLRRRALLSAKPQTAGMTDEQLLSFLRLASAFYQEYTRSEDPGEEVDALIVDIATIDVNMAGAEGSTMASEGGISRTWSRLPEDVKARLKARRRLIGVST